MTPTSDGLKPLAARLPRLGFGAAPIGNLYAPVSDGQAFEAVAEALAAGVTYFDTAPHYGFGLSESRLGAALAELDPGETTLVSTKVGRILRPIADPDAHEVRHGFAKANPYEPVFDYSYDAVLRSVEESRQRLQRSRIDMLLVHDLGQLTHGDDHERLFAQFMGGGYRALRALRDSGEVGAIGLGVNEWQAAEQLLAVADLDVILLAGRYTLLEQGALDSFLPLCAKRGVSVVIGGPFNSGVLARGAGGQPRSRYNYETAPTDVLARVDRLEAVCARFGVPLAAAALQFPLAHPAVAGVIAGLSSAAEVATARQLIDLAIPEALWDALGEEKLIDPRAPTPTESPAAHAAANPLILLSEGDNVLVSAGAIVRGQPLVIDGETFSAPQDIPVGHKVARRALQPGEKVLKYGAPIGSMLTPAAPGAWVHSHNLKSDYIASHGRAVVGGEPD